MASAVSGLLVVLVALFIWQNEHQQAWPDRPADVQVTEITPDAILPENEGKLVHLVGQATVAAPLRDTVWGVTCNDALDLIREVEVFRKTVREHVYTSYSKGGRARVTRDITNNPQWSVQPTTPAGAQSATSATPFELATRTGAEFHAQQFQIGAFAMPAGSVVHLPPMLVTLDPDKLPTTLKSEVHVESRSSYYHGNDPENQHSAMCGFHSPRGYPVRSACLASNLETLSLHTSTNLAKPFFL